MTQPQRYAFSLVELSIVLVILGLLVGGILSGQSLIRAAELRSIPADLARYQTAMHTFRDKYFSLPGDMPNATQFWGIAGGTGSDNACYSVASTSAATCNGNGNGAVDYVSGAAYFAEMHRFWQHLANAGLIEGRYTGQDGYSALGTKTPRSRISNAGYEVLTTIMGSWFGESFSTASDGLLMLFGTIPTNDTTRGVAIRPQEAWNIDTKIDDGKPDNGKLQIDTFFSAACYTGSYPNAAYALNVTTISCDFRYQLR